MHWLLQGLADAAAGLPNVYKEEGMVAIASPSQSDSYPIREDAPPERYPDNAVARDQPFGPFPCGEKLHGKETSQGCPASRGQ